MKRGFSLIEVVFAILIISISLMSIPMLLKESAKSNEFSMMQEVILATSTKMGNILSYSWDKNSYDSSNKILRTLDVLNGDSELKRVVTTPKFTRDNNLRVGHIFKNQRRRFYDYLKPGFVYPDTTVSSFVKRSINDFYAESKTLGGSGSFDYKDKNMKIVSYIYYVSDRADYSKTHIFANISPSPKYPITNNLKSTNIKMVEVNTTMPILGQNIVLRSYVSNVGQSKLLIRKK